MEFNLELELANRYLQNALTVIKTEKVVSNPKKKVSTNESTTERNQFSVECSRQGNFSMSSTLVYNGETQNSLNPNQTALSLTDLTMLASTNGQDPTKDISKDIKDGKVNPDLNRSSISMMSDVGNLALSHTIPKIEILKLPIKFNAKTCATYDCDIILRNLDNPFDIRVIKVSVLVKPKNIFAKLEFNCPVNCEITQKIPIYNNSDVDWVVKFDLNDNCKQF